MPLRDDHALARRSHHRGPPWRRCGALALALLLLASCLADEPTEDAESTLVTSQAVGRTESEGSVGHDGQALYRVPLLVPGGRAGIEPTLALAYASRRGNDLLGVGWTLEGFSLVHRCPKYAGRDGTTAPVGFEATDQYCVDGLPLRAVTGAYGASGTRYRTEPDTFAEWTSEGGGEAGPDRFTVRTRDGRYLHYGTDANSRVDGIARRVEDDGTPTVIGLRRAAWLLSEVSDRWDNTMTITYRHEPAGPGDLPHVVPERIEYTGVRSESAGNRRVWLDYEPRPDPIVRYSGGMRELIAIRLRRVRTEAPRQVGAPPEPVRSYELAYDPSATTSRTLLAAVHECDAAGTCLPATRFSYRQPPASPGFTSAFRADINPNATRLDGGDLDRDGRDELLYNRAFGRTAVRQALRGTANGQYGPEIQGPGDDTWNRAVFADVDADGRTELVLAPGTAGGEPLQPNVHRFTGVGFQPVATHALYSPSPLVVDLSGDAIPDELFVEDERWHYRVGDRTIDVHALAGPQPPEYAIEYAATADLDGDGRSELLLPRPEPGAAIPWRLDVFRPSGLTRTAIEHTRCNTFADVNGDGLADVVSLHRGLHVQINAGNGVFLPRTPAWTCAPGTTCDAPAFTVCDDGDPLTRRPSSYDHGLRVVDVNQDGRQDVLLFAATSGPTTALVTALIAADGDRLEATSLHAGYRTPFPAAGATSVAILDANADGFFDIAHIGTRPVIVDGELDDVRFVDVQVQNTSNADVLERVDIDRWGAVHGFVHAPLLRSDGYTDGEGGCDYPVQCARIKFPVVTIEQRSAGTALFDRFRHEYRDYRINLLHEDPLGFQLHRVLDTAAGETRVETGFDFSRVAIDGRHRHPYAAVPAVTYTMAFTGDPDRPRWLGRATEVLDWEARSTAGGRSYAAWPTRTRATVWESDEPRPPPLVPATILSRTVVASTFDDYGTETVRDVDRGLGYRERVERVVRNDTTRWLLGLVEHERVTGTAPGESVLREHQSAYDAATGALVTVTREPDASIGDRRAEWLRTSFTYTRGVRASTTVTDALGRSRTVATMFDADTIVPVRTVDPLGHASTLSWDPGLGVQVRATDPNGNWLQTAHDGFGRVRAVEQADGSVTTVSYETDETGGTAFPVVVRTASNAGASTSIFHDQRGLAVRRDDRFGDGVVRTTLSDRDAAGREVRQTRPFAAGAAVYSTWFGYDGAGRMTHRFRVGEHGLEVATTTYDGLATDRFDEEGRRTRELRDLAGHVVATSAYPDGPEAAPVTTTFAYGAFDAIARVTDAAGNVAALSYDRLGRRISTLDPDAGTRRVELDAFGQIVAEIDAAGTRTSYIHDALGRQILRTAPDGLDRWTWDTAPGGGIGRLHTKQRGDVITHYGYDAIGRMIDETTRVQGKSFSFGYTFDDRGRAARMTYPLAPGETEPFAVEAGYGMAGDLAAIRDVRTGLAIWTRGMLSPAGALASERLGNGLETKRSFDPGTGRVTRIATTGGASWSHDLRYAHDRSGNITARTDVAQGRTESFEYDGADRLVATTIPAGPAATFGYDLVGNRVGALEHAPGCFPSYGAGAAGPHALTAVTCADGTTTALGYDADGRLAERTGADPLTATWTTFHKVHRLERPAGRIELTYDADHQLVATRTQRGVPTDLSGVWSDTIRLGSYEQRVNGNGSVDHLYHVTAGGQTVASRIRSCPRPSTCADTWRYLHRDAMGSVERASDATGALVEARSYTAFGAPRDDDWGNPTYTPPTMTRIGYTGHIDVVEADLVDMGGRLYDPRLHTFLSPDPIVQAPLRGAAWNRYSYVFHNPLRYVDPTGFVSLDKHTEFMSLVPLAQYVGSSGFSSAAPGSAYSPFAMLTAITGAGGAYDGGLATFAAGFAMDFGAGTIGGVAWTMEYTDHLFNGYTFRSYRHGGREVLYPGAREFKQLDPYVYDKMLLRNKELAQTSAEGKRRIALSVATADFVSKVAGTYWMALGTIAMGGTAALGMRGTLVERLGEIGWSNWNSVYMKAWFGAPPAAAWTRLNADQWASFEYWFSNSRGGWQVWRSGEALMGSLLNRNPWLHSNLVLRSLGLEPYK